MTRRHLLFWSAIVLIALQLNFIASAAADPAAVVRPAPDFDWFDSHKEPVSIRNLRGQTVVLLIAPSPADSAFRIQMHRIEERYLSLSAKKMVVAVAFTAFDARTAYLSYLPTDVPPVIVTDGPATALLYRVSPTAFGCFVIGPNGNLDLISSNPITGQRILDMINNTVEAQTSPPSSRQ